MCSAAGFPFDSYAFTLQKQEGDGDVQEGVETLPISTKNVFSYIVSIKERKTRKYSPPPLKWLITICYELDCYLNVRLHEDPIFYLSGLSKKLTFSNVAHVHPHFCILHHDSTMLQRVVLQSAVICSNVERESERI